MSQDSLIFNGKKYISSRRASELTGYTTDYVGQLARGKKVSSRMVGRNRFVDENELLEYKANFNNTINGIDLNSVYNNHSEDQSVGETKTLDKDAGSSGFEEADSDLNDRSDISDNRDVGNKDYFDKHKALNTKISFVGSLLAVILLGVFLNTQPGAQGFKSFSDSLDLSSETSRNINPDTASISNTNVLPVLNKVDSVFLGYLDSLDQKIAIFAISVRDKILNIFADEPDVIYVDNTKPGVQVVSNETGGDVEFKVDDEKLKEYVREIMLTERNTFAPGGPYGGVVALPSSGDPVQDEILKNRIKESFSDEVIVQFDSSGSSGVIRPVFKSGAGLSENYMFLLVPVNK